MKNSQVWVKRNALREMKIVEREQGELSDGAVRVRIEKFGLTANNISYAVSGSAIGYWGYFPAEEEWGIVPAWGFGDVVESRCEDIPVGERLWGFFPMAASVDLQPERVNAANFFDGAEHRAQLPAMYNQYHRTKNDPPMLKQMEDERCLLFPLFATSFILADYLADNQFFGADQVVIGSASSKTGFGLAHMLHHDPKVSQRVVGLTSASNTAFVEALQVCDQVAAYDGIEQLDASVKTAFVDMAGNGVLVERVHEHLGENVVESCLVGATHWEASRKVKELPGAKPQFFFAPTHIAKREKDWGKGQVLMRAFMASIPVAQAVANQIDVQYQHGPQAAADKLLALLDNAVPPSAGLMLSLQEAD